MVKIEKILQFERALMQLDFVIQLYVQLCLIIYILVVQNSKKKIYQINFFYFIFLLFVKVTFRKYEPLVRVIRCRWCGLGRILKIVEKVVQSVPTRSDYCTRQC